jgi:hypothetical protein
LRQEDYEKFINDPDAFRVAVDRAFSECPELFPKAFAQGYILKDSYTSKKTGLCQRRIQCKATGESFQIRPCFILPYMTGQTKDVGKALFLRKFGVPFHALAYVFGNNPMYWYRLEVSLGRNSIVGTTLRQAALPEHLLADEHHRWWSAEGGGRKPDRSLHAPPATLHDLPDTTKPLTATRSTLQLPWQRDVASGRPCRPRPTSRA